MLYTARSQPTSGVQDGEHQTGSILYLWNGMTYRRNSNDFTHILNHARINGDTADIARQYEDLETSSFINGIPNHYKSLLCWHMS
jgi:hypothetical protein